MYLDNIRQYVALGSMFDEDEKTYRKHSFGPILLTLLAGTFPAQALKGYWSYMTVAMFLISIACVVTVFKLSSFVLTLHDALCLDAVIFGAWVLDLSILELMYFTMWEGFTPWLLLMYLPILVVPLFFGFKIYKALKSDHYSTTKPAKGGLGGVGITAGILGMSFAAIIFRNVEQSTAVVVILICISLLNGFMSLGMLSLQKLYYLKKYKPFG